MPPLCQTLVDAQATEDYATYIVTLGGNKSLEADPNPPVTQVLTHAQDLRIKPKEKVTITTMVWHQHHHLPPVCYESFASYHSINQSFFNMKHLQQAQRRFKIPKRECQAEGLS